MLQFQKKGESFVWTAKMSFRLFWAFFCFLLPGIFLILFRNSVFDLSIKTDAPQFLLRFFWVWALGGAGFFTYVAILVGSLSLGYVFEHQNIDVERKASGWPNYLAYYFFVILIVSSLIFSIVFTFYYDRNYLTFFFSGLLSFFYGFFIDNPSALGQFFPKIGSG